MSIEVHPRMPAGGRPARRRRQAGVTLLELIIFIVVVSVGVAGILAVMSFTASNSSDPLRRKQALMIAEGLLEEVQLAGMTVCDPGSDNADTAQTAAECEIPEVFGNEAPGSARPFDNVNDYVAAPGTPASPFNDNAGFLTDALGRRLGVAGYDATVTVTPAALGGIPAGTGADAGALRIRVRVTFDGDEPVVLDGYRTRYAPFPRFE